MSKDNKTLWEVLDSLKEIAPNNRPVLKEETPIADNVSPEKKCSSLELELKKLNEELKLLRSQIVEVNAAANCNNKTVETDENMKKLDDADKARLATMERYALELSRKLQETKVCSDRYYDKIQDLRTELLNKQRVLDHVSELVKPLLDPDSGADRHDVAEHILAVIEARSLENDGTADQKIDENPSV